MGSFGLVSVARSYSRSRKDIKVQVFLSHIHLNIEAHVKIENGTDLTCSLVTVDTSGFIMTCRMVVRGQIELEGRCCINNGFKMSQPSKQRPSFSCARGVSKIRQHWELGALECLIKYNR